MYWMWIVRVSKAAAEGTVPAGRTFTNKVSALQRLRVIRRNGGSAKLVKKYL